MVCDGATPVVEYVRFDDNDQSNRAMPSGNPDWTFGRAVALDGTKLFGGKFCRKLLCTNQGFA
jgi:hypothetical protein